MIGLCLQVFLSQEIQGLNTLWEQEWNSDLGLSDSKGHFVWYHIGCEVDSNGDVEGATVMTDLRDWVGGDLLDQERVWKESVMGRTVKHTQWKIWIKGHSVSTAP